MRSPVGRAGKIPFRNEQWREEIKIDSYDGGWASIKSYLLSIFLTRPEGQLTRNILRFSITRQCGVWGRMGAVRAYLFIS